jgi:hypothetical protein
MTGGKFFETLSDLSLSVVKFLYEITLFISCNSSQVDYDLMESFTDIKRFQKEMISERWVSIANKEWSWSRWAEILHVVARFLKCPLNHEELSNFEVSHYQEFVFEN